MHGGFHFSHANIIAESDEFLDTSVVDPGGFKFRNFNLNSLKAP